MAIGRQKERLGRGKRLEGRGVAFVVQESGQGGAESSWGPELPTQAEVDHDNVTHTLFRAWCPACVSGLAQDRPHKGGGEENLCKLGQAYDNAGFPRCSRHPRRACRP